MGFRPRQHPSKFLAWAADEGVGCSDGKSTLALVGLNVGEGMVSSERTGCSQADRVIQYAVDLRLLLLTQINSPNPVCT